MPPRTCRPPFTIGMSFQIRHQFANAFAGPEFDLGHPRFELVIISLFGIGLKSEGFDGILDLLDIG